MSGVVTRLLLVLAALIAGYWLLLFLVQRRLVFPAPALAAVPPRPQDAEPLWLELPSGRTEAWYLPPLTATASPAGVVIFAHGNGELIDDWATAFTDPRRWGLAVLLVEYPGYGRSGGAPSQASIQQAFEAAYDWAARNPVLDRHRIMGYGRSLGGGAVCALSRSRALAALVLESTFTHTAAFAGQFGAPGFLVRDRFDNLTAVARFPNPVLVLHGGNDDIIPPDHGRRLAAAAGVELHLLPCGHNDCDRPWSLVRPFLIEHGLLGRGSGISAPAAD